MQRYCSYLAPSQRGKTCDEVSMSGRKQSYYSLDKKQRYAVINLGDNCIQIFHLGRYIVGYMVGNFDDILLQPSGQVLRILFVRMAPHTTELK